MTILENNLIPEEIRSTYLYVEINADGRDSFKGNPSVSFSFSDGTIINANYESFQIGTYHESHTTHLKVIGIR